MTTIVFLLLSSIPGMALGENKSAETHILSLSMQNEVWVNDDYNESTPGWGEIRFKTIQEGVDAVNSNGTIGNVTVYNGTYYESVIIKKPVRIRGLLGNDGCGEDSNYPPIVSDPTVAFIIIGDDAKKTNISHFNINGSSVAGVMILASNSINVSLNNIFSNRRGIYILSSPDCNITHNNVINNTYMGISLENSNRCIINGNYVANNDRSGIDLAYSDAAYIANNYIGLNGNYTIWIGPGVNKNEIYRNDIIDKTPFSKPWQPRFFDSKNLWNNNYWSDHTNGSIWYFVRGSYVIGFKRWIPWWQVDTASQKDPWGHQPNEI